MSQDIDAEFADILNSGMGVEADAINEVLGGSSEVDQDASAAAAVTSKVDIRPAPATKEPAQPALISNKPSIASKKRPLQVVLPQESNKRRSLQVKANSGMSEGTTLPPKDSSLSPSPSGLPAEPTEPSTLDASPAPSAPASAASSPVKKPTAPAATTEEDTKAEAETVMNVDEEGVHQDQEDTEMAEAPADEPEVQSPLKKAPAPEADDEPSMVDKQPTTTAAPAAAPAAPSGGAVSGKALAAGKRKGLTVAKAATGIASTAPAPAATLAKAASTKPKAIKPPAPKKAAAGNASSSAAAGAASDGAPQKLPKPQTAYFFFTADKRAEVKEANPGLSMPEMSKKLGEMWKELGEDDKKPYQDKAAADKERVAAELAAMDPEVMAAIKKASADARAAKKDKKADKAAGKASTLQATAEAKESKGSVKAADKEAGKAEKAADKEAKKAEKAAAKAAAKAEKAAKKQAEKARATKMGKAGYKVYHNSMFSTIKAVNPEADVNEVNKLTEDAWRALEQAEKDKYFKMAEELAEAEAAAKAANKPAGRPPKGKRGKKAASSDGEESEDEGGSTRAGRGSRRRAAAGNDDDDESDREDVDWDGHPATDIFSHGSAFMVAREGLMLSEYGKVDTRKAKERLLHGGASSSAAELPVSTQQVDEYEKSCQKFWAAVKGRMRKGPDGVGLDLDELEEGSPLELCYVLAKLQEEGELLDPTAKHPKDNLEVVRRLPVMRLSMVVQRLLELERRDKARVKRLLELERRDKAHAQQSCRELSQSCRRLLKAIEDGGGDELKQSEEVAAAASLLEQL